MLGCRFPSVRYRTDCNIFPLAREECDVDQSGEDKRRPRAPCNRHPIESLHPEPPDVPTGRTKTRSRLDVDHGRSAGTGPKYTTLADSKQATEKGRETISNVEN